MAEVQEPIGTDKILRMLKELSTQVATKKDLEGLATKKDLDATKKDLKGLSTEMKGLSTEMKGLATKKDLEGLATKKDLEATKKDLEGLSAKVDRLIEATPAAVPVPNVFVLGKPRVARLLGSVSTWTMVKARTSDLKTENSKHSSKKSSRSDNGEFRFFLVSCAHCVHSVIAGSNDTSILPICANAALVISEINVIRVGFHKDSSGSEYKFDGNPHTNIVFLELEEKAETLVEAPLTIPIIAPLDFEFMTYYVSGTSLSGRVNGSGLQWNDDKKVYSFIPSIAGPGCSGTLMYTARDIIVGIFKGTREMNRARGLIVPFPKWDQVEWFDCTAQLAPFNDHDNTLEGFHWYLTLGECKPRSFQTSSNSPHFGDGMRSGIDSDEDSDQDNDDDDSEEDEDFPGPPDVTARDSTTTCWSKAVKRARGALCLAMKRVSRA
jgi:hypothetical protein